MADKIKEKKSFFGFEQIDKNKFAPTGHRYRSKNPGGAARKEAVRIMSETGKNECVVFIRQAFESDRVRKYTGTMGEDRFPEFTAGAKFMKCTQEEFKGDEPEFLKMNQYFAKTAGNPETKQPWTPEEVQIRNAELQADGSIKLLPGMHNVFSAKTAKCKYIAPKIKLPEGTVIHPAGETDDEPEVKPEAPKAADKPKSKGKRSKSKTKPEATPAPAE
jgi:hypothetical protein